MTIAERKAREAYDKENPWRPMDPGPSVGLICDLLFDDLGGYHSAEQMQYFQDANRDWFQIDPPRQMFDKPMNWRPAQVTLRPDRRNYIVRQAKGDK